MEFCLFSRLIDVFCCIKEEGPIISKDFSLSSSLQCIVICWIFSQVLIRCTVSNYWNFSPLVAFLEYRGVAFGSWGFYLVCFAFNLRWTSFSALASSTFLLLVFGAIFVCFGQLPSLACPYIFNNDQGPSSLWFAFNV